MDYLMMFLLFASSVFLVLLVLIQRGRGGGLAGAFGGMGGQSAFGTKAGDLFTRITIGVAAFWIILCAASVKLLGKPESFVQSGHGAASRQTLPPSSSKGGNKPGATGPAATKEQAPAKSDTKDTNAEEKPAESAGDASTAPADDSAPTGSEAEPSDSSPATPKSSQDQK